MLISASWAANVANAVQLPCGHRVDRVLAWKQPGARPANAPPRAQDIEQQRRQHRLAILAPLALLDAEQHARAVNIGDLQRHDFGGPESRAIGDAQRRLVLGAGRRVEEAGDFILGQDRGQLPGLLDPEQRLRSSYRSSVMLKKNRSAVMAEFTLAAQAGSGRDGDDRAVTPPSSQSQAAGR